VSGQIQTPQQDEGVNQGSGVNLSEFADLLDKNGQLDEAWLGRAWEHRVEFLCTTSLGIR
jgi:hypothetical protein